MYHVDTFQMTCLDNFLLDRNYFYVSAGSGIIEPIHHKKRGHENWRSVKHYRWPVAAEETKRKQGRKFLVLTYSDG